MAVQGEKLTQTMEVAVVGLDRLDGVSPVVADLGRRHVGYGVTRDQYEGVGAALLWTLKRGPARPLPPSGKGVGRDLRRADRHHEGRCGQARAP